jgi:predicted membrane protein
VTRAAWSCGMMGMIAVVGWRYQATVWSDVFAPQEGGIL